MSPALAEPGVVAVGLEHENAGESAHPIKEGDALFRRVGHERTLSQAAGISSLARGRFAVAEWGPRRLKRYTGEDKSHPRRRTSTGNRFGISLFTSVNGTTLSMIGMNNTDGARYTPTAPKTVQAQRPGQPERQPRSSWLIGSTEAPVRWRPGISTAQESLTFVPLVILTLVF